MKISTLLTKSDLGEGFLGKKNNRREFWQVIKKNLVGRHDLPNRQI